MLTTRTLTVWTALAALVSMVAMSDQALAVVTGVKDAVVNAYVLSYIDRATWITGCF